MENTSSIQKVIGDIVDLCELQLQLLSVDSQAAKRKLTRAIACGAVGATLGASALTVALVGLGFLVPEFTELSIAAGLLIVSGIAFAIVGLLLIVALLAVKAAANAMNETKSEFSENLRWLKATLVKPKTSARNQLRTESFPDADVPASTSRFTTDSTSPFVQR